MHSRYVLLTAAKDEERSIGDIIQAVLRQTIRPVAWFIMDDGSSDRTAAIISGFAKEHPFIHLQSAGSRGGRNFGSQYKAVMAAYELAKPLEFEFVGVVDADQAPESADYYESMLGEFARNPRLGIGSGFLYERYNGSDVWESRRANSRDSVAGGTALFRRKCFDQIGGYRPLVLGGSDWLIQIEARMAGWEITTRPDLHIFHYRPTSSAGGIWRGLFKAGKMDAAFGSNSFFEFLKCCRRVTTNPYFFGSVVRYCGFLSWKLSFRGPCIPPAAVAYLRRDQAAKLRRWFRAPGSRSLTQLEVSAPRS